MKKAIIIFTAFSLVLLCGCSANGKKNTESNNASTNEMPIGLANPMVKSSADGILNDMGVCFGVPKNAQNINYFIINKNLANMQFTVNGTEYDARIKWEAEYTDISGYYYKWENESECEIKYCKGNVLTHRSENTVNAICLWFDAAPGIMYSLSTSSPSFSADEMVKIANEIFVPMQGDAG